MTVRIPVSLGEQGQALADKAVAQQQDILGGHAPVDQQAEDKSPQHSTHTVTHLQTG